MANTYTLISSNVLTGSAASVTFSSIPSTYTDLVLRYTSRTDNAVGATVEVRTAFNGSSSTTSYSTTYLQGTGSAASSARESGVGTNIDGYTSGNSSTANTFGSGEIYIPNYASAINHPLSGFGVAETNATAAYMGITAGLSSIGVAITALEISPYGIRNWVSGSSFYLYGIKNA